MKADSRESLGRGHLLKNFSLTYREMYFLIFKCTYMSCSFKSVAFSICFAINRSKLNKSRINQIIDCVFDIGIQLDTRN